MATLDSAVQALLAYNLEVEWWRVRVWFSERESLLRNVSIQFR